MEITIKTFSVKNNSYFTDGDSEYTLNNEEENNMALTDNLVRYYRCNDNAASTVVTDATGNANGTASGNTNTIDAVGKITGSFVLNGSSEYFAGDSALDFSGTNPFTFNIWYKKTANNNTDLLTYTPNNGTSRIRIQPYDNTDTHLYFYRGGVGIDATKPTDNEWVMATMTYSGTQLRAYINGTEVASLSPAADTNSLSASTKILNIGRRENGVNYFTGNVEAFGIWTRALSAAEITSLYNGGAGLDYPLTIPTTTTNASLLFALT
jgi:hypothetical protein